MSQEGMEILRMMTFTSHNDRFDPHKLPDGHWQMMMNYDPVKRPGMIVARDGLHEPLDISQTGLPDTAIRLIKAPFTDVTPSDTNEWFFIIVFLMASTNILGLEGVTDFLRTVVLYVPNVIVAAIILLIGILVAKVLEGFVLGTVKAAGLVSANFLAALTKWAVLIFTLLVALSQLNVADYVINALITGLIAAGALAIGLSFGLGGVKHADQFLGNLKKKIEDFERK